jgi:hypothetical protein
MLLRVEVSIFVLRPEIEDRVEVEVETTLKYILFVILQYIYCKYHYCQELLQILMYKNVPLFLYEKS